LLSSPSPTQPWDREDWVSSSPPTVSAALAPVRRAVLEKSLGHYPALFAILDCVEFGLPQSFDGAIRSEMTSFTKLILRSEPRAMIQTLFLGRVDYERLERKGQLPDLVGKVVAAVRAVLDSEKGDGEALGAAGFAGLGSVRIEPLRQHEQSGYWIEGDDPRAKRSLAILKQIHDAVAPLAGGASVEELRVADYAAIRQTGYPGYLGGPFSFAAGRWT
jgi:3-hydroxyacyl-CoA dehydrogenase/enoyl-CoA hydratase/3-hydroxybutyryl-CoA epimerase